MDEKGQGAIELVMILILVGIVALFFLALMGQAATQKIAETGKTSTIDIASEPEPVTVVLDLSRAADQEFGVAECSDAFPWAIEPSAHLEERVATDALRFTAWSALKFCGDNLRVWYCPEYSPQMGSDAAVGAPWSEFALECPSADGATCAVGIVLASATDGLPPGTRLGVTAYKTPCERHHKQMAARNCIPVTTIRFAFP